MATPEKQLPPPDSSPKRDDELEQYFGDRSRIDHSINLGFENQDEIEHAIASLKRLMVHPAVSERVIGKYQGILEGQLPHVAQRQTNRRRLIRNLVVGGIAVAVVPVVYTNCLSPEVQQRVQEEERQRKLELESRRTLGLAATSISSYGWRARYGQKQEGIQYEDTGITFTVGKRTYINYHQSPLLEDTGLWLDRYVRTDGKLVPRLYVQTVGTELSSSVASDDWILRDSSDNDSLIDTRVLILENDRDPILRPLRLYASIDPIKGGESFEVKLKKPVDQNQKR